ncbi:helix-turn-helix domain-containing protein [Larkinella soli]|uniref:helix-turn-helix domain-containing protein n=1 Tax=Larkinella soli TaxID=1770527 RepID=UPI000FFB52AD|nr:helix-turn-helix domain-containing protein [Larkinella soli]
MKFILTLLSGILLLATAGRAQLVVEVVRHPPLNQSGPGLFIAGEFNNWNPGDPAYQLTQRDNGVYFIELPDTLQHFEYKYTQGSWTAVEGMADGSLRPNRVYDRRTARSPALVRDTITAWERKPGYQFVVTELPGNTPVDARLYISGNFNEWDAGDEQYRLRKQVDGTYRVTVHTDLPQLEYKFTRGSWEMVEGSENGKALPNRLLNRYDDIDNKAIEIRIQSWEDLSGTFNFFSIYDLLLLFSAFQGFLLLFFIPSIQNYNRAANRWLVILMGVSSLLVLIRVVSSFREVAQIYTKMLLLPDFLYFVYAPLFYIYVQKLLFKPSRLSSRWPYHFIPAAVQLLAYMPLFLMESRKFQHKIVNQTADVTALFLVTGLAGLIFNGLYWLRCRRMIEEYKRQYQSSLSYEQNVHYFNTVLVIQAVCLVLWLFTFLLLGVGQGFRFDVATIAGRSVDTIWLAFSTIVYFLGYFAIHQPEIFKVRQFPADEPPRPGPGPETDPAAPDTEAVPTVVSAPAAYAAPQPEPEEDLEPVMQQVEAYMKRHKPYTNPSLTINELAGKLKMQPHQLSRVINDGFDKNFFDFINYYRVEELKQCMDDPRFRHYTLLSLAYEVGFNSKTSFNRAFKKLTQQTPSEYFQAVKE